MDPTVQVALISTLGLITVTAIGVLTAKITSGARKDSAKSAVDASASAELARDYAAAAGAKDALIAAINDRVKQLEAAEQSCKQELQAMREENKLRKEEDEAQKQAAHHLEHQRVAEITELRSQIDSLKASR